MHFVGEGAWLGAAVGAGATVAQALTTSATIKSDVRDRPVTGLLAAMDHLGSTGLPAELATGARR